MSIESRNGRFDAARPVFNMEQDGDGVVLTSTNGNKVSLTDRQFEVVGRICSGNTDLAEIGEALVITRKTVKNHLTPVYKAFGIEDPKDNKMPKLLAILVGEGYLRYEPKIRG